MKKFIILWSDVDGLKKNCLIIGKNVLSFLVFSMHKMLFPLLILCLFLTSKVAYHVCFLVPRQYKLHVEGIMLLWGFPRLQIMDTMY